ncbi:MAG TPA: peptidylprolyl isomerase, partial [Polyangia bacterium]
MSSLRPRCPRVLVGCLLAGLSIACNRGGTVGAGRIEGTPSHAPVTAPATEPAEAPPVEPEVEYLPLAPIAGTPPALREPPRWRSRAPAKFHVKVETTAGDFVVQVTRAWAPRGADRFYNLVRSQFYRGVRVHRVIPSTLVQFGIHFDPTVNLAWFDAPIPDDDKRQRNRRGLVALAAVGAGSRRTELIVNLKDNAGLDTQGIVPFGKVVRGLDVVDRLS